MDTLHTVLRTIRGETKSRDHLAVFREFLSHLDRIGKRAGRRPPAAMRRHARTGGKRRR